MVETKEVQTQLALRQKTENINYRQTFIVQGYRKIYLDLWHFWSIVSTKNTVQGSENYY